MENIVFERNYELPKEADTLSSAIFEQAFAPGGFFEEYTKKMDAIPKVIVPEDKANYEYLLERCDDFVQKHHGRIRGVVDYRHWDSHIELFLPMFEFDDEEDMELLKDIGEKAHYLSVTHEDGKYHVYILINYFKELMSDEYEDYLKYETIMQDSVLAAMMNISELPEEDKATTQLINELLDRFDNETSVDRTTAFMAVVDYLVKEESADITVERIAAMLMMLLEKILDEEKHGEDE